MSYQPNQGSVASRVIAYLSSKPPGFTATNAALSRELGAPAGSFAGNLNMAVNAGLVHKQAGDGREMVWVLGPRMAQPAGQTEPPPEADDSSESEAVSVVAAHEPTSDTGMVEQIKEAWPTPSTTPANPAFACALFNDGRLYLELGDETMTLQVEHTRALLAYLERVAMP
jgi:hypothetical protein